MFKHLLFIGAVAGGIAKADMPAIHGMLLFGHGHVYVSHLPMFHPPHDYQAIAEVKLSEQVQTVYESDSAVSPKDTIYTIVPEKFSLPETFKEGKTFSATIYNGHFEKNGHPIGSGKVTISNVVVFKKLNKDMTKPASQSLIIFGSPDQLFAAHTITGAPDFDQITKVSGEFFYPSLPAKTGVSNDSPLEEGQTILVNANTRLAQFLSVVQTIYTEFEDLKD